MGILVSFLLEEQLSIRRFGNIGITSKLVQSSSVREFNWGITVKSHQEQLIIVIVFNFSHDSSPLLYKHITHLFTTVYTVVKLFSFHKVFDGICHIIWFN